MNKLLQELADPTKPATVKIESELVYGAIDYLKDNNFTMIIPPHMTKATGACENIDTMFELDYFGKNVFLSQTGQLYLESFIKQSGNVYCIGPSFRKEPEADDRHLTEFTLIELEFPTRAEDGMNELTAHVEGVILSMVKRVLKTCRQELAVVGADVKALEELKAPFEKITYTEAIDLLDEVNWGDDLKSRHEQHLVEKFGNKPLFITHFPAPIKFFNMEPNKDNPEVVNSTDLVFPKSGEAVGAACRIHKPEQLIERLETSQMMKQLNKKGIGTEVFDWYIDVVREHGMPHAGFGLGLGRVVQYVTNTADIRKSTAFPLNAEEIY